MLALQLVENFLKIAKDLIKSVDKCTYMIYIKDS